MNIVLIESAALAEIEQSRAWYESREIGLGDRFEDAVMIAITHIRAFPEAYPILYRETRRIRLAIFPYNLYYR